MKKLALALGLVLVVAAHAETWMVVNDTDTVKIERSSMTKKADKGFVADFRKTDKASKEVTPLVFAVDCSEKFYELKTIAKPGDDPTVISTGIANPDNKLYAYIEKGCK